ncbi:MAG: hypothetical protein HUJ51_06425, partial [Eggerthellaceae bacterium]|nr:hypothetical protein [Eggerthellaceae bacterium]
NHARECGGGVYGAEVTQASGGLLLGGTAIIFGNTSGDINNPKRDNLYAGSALIKVRETIDNNKFNVGVTSDFASGEQTFALNQTSPYEHQTHADLFTNDLFPGLFGVDISTAYDGPIVWNMPEIYIVTLGNNVGTGGKCCVGVITYSFDMLVLTGEGDLPTREGCISKGYADEQGNLYYNADGTSAQVWSQEAEDTLYAVWEEIILEVPGDEGVRLPKVQIRVMLAWPCRLVLPPRLSLRLPLA